MNFDRKRLLDVKVIVGAFIILLAALLLLRNLDLIPYIDLMQFWPIILVVVGLNYLLRPPELRQNLPGVLFLAAGILLLADNLGYIYFTFRDIWPFILLIIGIAILRHAIRGKRIKSSDADYLNLTFILGGGDQKFSSNSLKGGKVTAFMGGGTIDLRDCTPAEKEVYFDLFALWGGIELVVPKNWQVNIEGMPLLGGIENQTHPDEEGLSGKYRLIVKGTAIMGGLEVKN